MADFKDEASAAYYTTKVDAKIAIARNEMSKLAASGATGKAGPELTKLIQEFDGYVGAWGALKNDPAYKQDPAQLAGVAQNASDSIDAYVIRAQQADAIDDAKAASAKAKSDADYSKMADESAKKGPKGSAPSPPATPAAAAPSAPPAGEKSAPPMSPSKAIGGDTWLLVAAVGLGAAALLYSGKKR
jgi:hypothetical protein